MTNCERLSTILFELIRAPVAAGRVRAVLAVPEDLVLQAVPEDAEAATPARTVQVAQLAQAALLDLEVNALNGLVDLSKRRLATCGDLGATATIQKGKTPRTA
ncbi:MAG: hypothetical protein ACKO38_09570 [Planctomycetota bacterium]